RDRTPARRSSGECPDDPADGTESPPWSVDSLAAAERRSSWSPSARLPPVTAWHEPRLPMQAEIAAISACWHSLVATAAGRLTPHGKTTRSLALSEGEC